MIRVGRGFHDLLRGRICTFGPYPLPSGAKWGQVSF